MDEIASTDDELDPAQIARDWAYELVRGFVAVDNLLQQQYAREHWESPPQVAARLVDEILRRIHDMPIVFGPDSMDLAATLLSEAIDNLGSGVELDAWDALALNAPVGPRSHRCVTDDPAELSREVEQARVELLRRGIHAVREREQDGKQVLDVTCADPEWADRAIPDMLRGIEHHYLGRMPREIFPTRCLSWRPKGERVLRVWATVHEDEHLDEIVVAEDDRQILVSAFVCTPTGGSGKPRHAEPVTIDVERPIGDREVVDVFGRRVLPRDDHRPAAAS